MGVGGEIMAGCGWLWVFGVKLWLVVGAGGEPMPVRVWSRGMGGRGVVDGSSSIIAGINAV